jgi:hypothetical protein
LAAPTIYAEPAGASSTASRTQEVQQMTLPPFVIEDFVKVERSTLRGFAKVRTPSGIIFHDVAIHRQADAAWASPASKPLLNRDGQHTKDASGKAQWVPIVSFTSRELRDKFSTAVIDALRISHPDLLL